MTANFIQDKDMAQTCSLAGIATMKGKATELRSLAKLVADQIREVDKEKDFAGLINKALLVSKVVKATADAFIDLASTVTGPQGDKVSAGYSALSQFGSGASKMANGQSGGLAEMAKGGVSAIGLGKPAETTGLEDCLAEFSKNTTNNVIDGLNSDPDSIKGNLRNTGAACGAAAVEAGAKAKWGDKVGKTLGGGVKVANSLYTYNNELNKAIDDWAKDEDELGHFDSSKRMLQTQLKNLELKIRELDQMLENCAQMQAPAPVPVFACS